MLTYSRVVSAPLHLFKMAPTLSQAVSYEILRYEKRQSNSWAACKTIKTEPVPGL